jgi:hypothetical protein
MLLRFENIQIIKDIFVKIDLICIFGKNKQNKKFQRKKLKYITRTISRNLMYKFQFF